MDIDLSEAKISRMHIHLIGSNTREELVLSTNEVVLSLPEELLLKAFFFNSVDTQRFFRFTHEIAEDRNDAFYLTQQFNTAEISLLELSTKLANKLYKQSGHNKINLGEFFVVHFENIRLGDSSVQGLGLFKSDAPADFLVTEQDEEGIHPLFGKGISLDKTDKAALILLNDDQFKVCVNGKVTALSKYWYDDFLGVQPIEDEYFHTTNYLDMVKDFALNREQEDRASQVDLLNRSVDYFKENEHFDEQEFEQKVLREPEVQEAFKEHQQHFMEERHIDPFDDNFEISNHAVSTAKRRFRSVIKLDKNFHLYVHGKRDLIERGFDSNKGLNYYKLYFEDES